MEEDPAVWIEAVHRSHERLSGLLDGLDADALRAPSYASEWSIAEVASHLGSQAEIFTLFLEAGLAGADAPGGEVFGPIWDAWNNRSPQEQATGSIAANAAFLALVDSLDAGQRASLRLDLFGGEIGLAGLLQMRLSEHAVHTWDIAVALDPAATLAPDAVALLVDALAPLVGRMTPDDQGKVDITTTDPVRAFRIGFADTAELIDVTGDTGVTADLDLPAEAFIRLLYGRLDADHSPVQGPTVDRLRAAFPGI